MAELYPNVKAFLQKKNKRLVKSGIITKKGKFGFIKVNKSNCKNFSQNFFLDKYSKIEISNQEDS